MSEVPCRKARYFFKIKKAGKTMIRILAGQLNANSMFAIQRSQYSEKIYLSDTVTAATTKLGKVSVSNIGHFLCQYITGSFTALCDNGSGAIVDNGVCQLKGQLIDGTGQRKLFSDYIPLNLFLSPGRVKDITATNNLISTVAANQSDKSDSLFYPLEFEYLFPANTDIQLDVKNAANKDNSYSICFHGVRILI